MWDELASQIEFELNQLRKPLDLYRPLVDRSARDEPDRIEAAALGAQGKGRVDEGACTAAMAFAYSSRKNQ